MILPPALGRKVGEWAEARAQDQSTWTLRDPHGEAKTTLGHLLQPLEPPTHDRDALLTIQFNLVQGASSPLRTTNSRAQWAGGGHGEGADGCSNSQSCQDILSPPSPRLSLSVLCRLTHLSFQ